MILMMMRVGGDDNDDVAVHLLMRLMVVAYIFVAFTVALTASSVYCIFGRSWLDSLLCSSVQCAAICIDLAALLVVGVLVQYCCVLCRTHGGHHGAHCVIIDTDTTTGAAASGICV